jgi:hypothetical protein
MIFSIALAHRLSSGQISTSKCVPSHGIGTTEKDKVNSELPEFIKA